MSESEQKKIILKNISGQALRLIIDYCYTGEIEINADNIETLLPAASQLEFVEIETECSKFLENLLEKNPLNCLSYYSAAYLYNFEGLKSLAIKFMCEQFKEIKDTEDILSLEFDGLVELVKHDELKAEREEDVFTTVLNWINHDEESRKQHLTELLKNVRYTQMEATVSVTQIYFLI